MQRRRIYRKIPKIPMVGINQRGKSRKIRASLPLECFKSSGSTDTLPEQPAAVTVEVNQQTDPHVQSSSLYADRRKKTSDAWASIRDTLLSTRIEEFCPATFECVKCGVVQQDIIKCTDCSGLAYYCSQCCINVHTSVWFHNPMVWKGTIFIPWEGQMRTFERHNHDCGSKYMKEMCLIDAKGLQQKGKMMFCRCESESIGLIRYGFWPTSPQQPRVAVDLQLMELTSVLELEGQLSLKTFCEVLDHRDMFRINNLKAMKDVYKILVGDCVNEYRYHRSQLKQCSLLDCGTCPACSKSSNKRIVAVDANFGLVHKKSSGEGFDVRHKDNPFFLKQNEVDRYVNDYQGSRKENGCSTFQAGNNIRSKNKTAKLDITGVFGSVCKHDHPLKFCNLRHGEKLAYSVLFLEQVHSEACGKDVIFMYDIACMLRKHLVNNNRMDLIDSTTFAVPVFHSFAHNRPCQLSFGQRNVIPTGMSDGEGTERLWSFLRKFSRISKEMTIGNRHDLLVDALFHFSEKIKSKLVERVESKYDTALAAKKQSLETLTKKSSLDEARTLFEQRASLNRTIKSVKDDNLTITNEEEFSWLSLEASNKKKEIEVSILVEKDNLCDQLHRIEKKLDKIQKKVTVDDDQLESLLQSYKKKMSAVRKQELKTLSSDRLHLLSSLKKYADGQDVANRLTRQLQTTCSKLRTLLDTYNQLQPLDQRRTFTEVLDPQGMFFSDTQIDTLSVEQNRIADEYASFMRSDVEMADSISDMTNMVKWIQDQQNRILSKIEEIQGCMVSRYAMGQKSLLMHLEFSYEQLLVNARDKFLKHIDMTLKTPVSDHVFDLLQISHFDTVLPVNDILTLLEEQDCIYASESSDDDAEDSEDI